MLTTLKELIFMLRYISVLLLFCSNQLIAQNSFLIKGSFKDYNGVIYFKYDNKTDSCIARNGTFTYKGNIDLPIPASLFINDTKEVYFNEFVLEPGELTVRVDTTTRKDDGKPSLNINTTVLQGGKTNALLDSFRSTLSKNASQMANKSVAEKKEFYIETLREFLRQYPNEMASLILIEQASSGFSQQDLISFYENLNTNLKSGYYGISLKAAIDKNNKAVVQMPIKEFAQADLNGRSISISSLRGKVVLIDFWASWCIPCRQENPNLSRIYQKYKSKGFEILGVSLDADRKNWLKAVEQDKLNWLHVSDLRGQKNEIAVTFNIDAIPDNILIDREGRIMAKRITSQELEQILNGTL